MSRTDFSGETCIRCDGTGVHRDRTCGRCGGDGHELEIDEAPMSFAPTVDQDTLKFERYQSLLGGEIIGLVLGAGIVWLIAGNPYIGLFLVLSALTFHLTARKAIRG